MFESGIFASFIPQILMVLAYISFLIAPSLKSEKITSTEITDNKTIVISNENINLQIITCQWDIDLFTNENDNSNSLISYQNIKTSFLYDFIFNSHFLNHTLFCRPPPLYL